jgi:hypothetical protein
VINGRLRRQSPGLLRQKTDVSQDVRHFFIREFAAPGMHRTEDNPVLNGPQQFLVRFRKDPNRWKLAGATLNDAAAGPSPRPLVP